MSGAAAILRQRRRDNARPLAHRTRQNTADVLRSAALSMLRAPYCNDEMRDHANEMLEMVGEALDLPRHGWYPKRPAGWTS